MYAILSTPVVKAVLDTRSELKKLKSDDGTSFYPIKIRVTYQRTQRYFKLSLPGVAKNGWDKILSGARMSKTQREVFHGIREGEAKAIEIIDSLHPFNFHGFKSAWYSDAPIESSKSFVPFFKQYIENLKAEERFSTASSYQCALTSLLSFQKTIQWGDLTPAFFKEYESFMTEGGKSLNTVGIYLRSLRAVMNSAAGKGIFNKEHYPFGKRSHNKYPIPASKNTKRALNKEEVEMMKKYSAKKDSRAERAQYFWLFSYYLNGCNVTDIAHLQWKNIDAKEGVIQFVRKKTERSKSHNQVLITGVINDHVKSTIKKYGTPSQDLEGFVFPIISPEDNAEQRHKKIKDFVRGFNIGLKQISQDLGLNKKLTSYTARHSHAYALFTNGVSMEVIMDQFKHSSMQTTMNYIDSIDNEKRKNVSKYL